MIALVPKNTPVRVYPGLSRGMLGRAVMLSPISTEIPTTVSAADLDGDGWADLVVGARPTNLLLNAAGG